MRRTLLVAAVALAALAHDGAAQDVDSALIRIERLVVGGDRSSARHLADSLVIALPPDSPRFADVLYWRAQSATSAVDAERDYLRIAVEYSFTTRAPDALLALGQLELSRGDRNSARRRFDRVLRDYPRGRHVVRASLWSARLALEERDYVAGCATLNAARPLLTADEIELQNQFDYYLSQCDRAPATPADTTMPPVATDSTAAPGGGQFSVQVAAYSARRDAMTMASRLRERGFDVRVVGDRAPYRVRIGRYPARAAAMAALARMRASRVDGMVVEAEPPSAVRK
jgi:sporulation related protein